MVITKLGKSTTPKDKTSDTSKQASTAALALTAQTIQFTMKFDSALQHILDVVYMHAPTRAQSYKQTSLDVSLVTDHKHGPSLTHVEPRNLNPYELARNCIFDIV